MGLSTLDPIASIQLAPLTPFYHQFSKIAKAVIERDGNDETYILPTTLYLMSLATVISGISYFIVGKLGYAKVASFFPRYVMLGLVGGCGFFFMCLSICVSVGPGQCSADLQLYPKLMIYDSYLQFYLLLAFGYYELLYPRQSSCCLMLFTSLVYR